MTVRVGVVGTGFVSTHFVTSLGWHPQYEVSSVLTRRPLAGMDHPAADVLTNSLEGLLSESDVLFECSGDPIHATEVIAAAVEVRTPVVTLNSEFHVTSGSHFVGKGLVTEAEGDQPGSLAALSEEAVGMGFRPLVYGNMKGFLNHNPSPDEMEYWAAKQGLSVAMTTSFTDGTKLQIEQALVANGLGATIAVDGLLGPAVDDLAEAAEILGAAAQTEGSSISDYVLSPKLSHGVFLVAEHHAEHQSALRYFKLGDGPLYVLQKPNILVHLEVVKTLDRVFQSGVRLLDNSQSPTVSVAAVAKEDLQPGTTISRAIGSFALRGIAVRIEDHPRHVPIGLIQNGTIVESVKAGSLITRGQIELPDSLAHRIWRETFLA